LKSGSVLKRELSP